MLLINQCTVDGGIGMELDILDVNIKYLRIYLIMIYQVIK